MALTWVASLLIQTNSKARRVQNSGRLGLHRTLQAKAQSPSPFPQFFLVDSLLRNLLEEPLEAVILCTFHNACWKFLSVISYNSAPLLITTSAN